MDKLSEMSHADRIAYLASKVALAKSYDSPVLTVPIPDLEILLAELEAKDKRIDELEAKLATPVRLPRTLWYEHDDLAHEIPVLEKKKVVAAICGAGFTVEGNE